MTYESALNAENEFQKNENISLAQDIIEDQETYRRRNALADEEASESDSE